MKKIQPSLKSSDICLTILVKTDNKEDNIFWEVDVALISQILETKL